MSYCSWLAGWKQTSTLRPMSEGASRIPVLVMIDSGSSRCKGHVDVGGRKKTRFMGMLDLTCRFTFRRTSSGSERGRRRHYVLLLRTYVGGTTCRNRLSGHFVSAVPSRDNSRRVPPSDVDLFGRLLRKVAQSKVNRYLHYRGTTPASLAGES